MFFYFLQTEYNIPDGYFWRGLQSENKAITMFKCGLFLFLDNRKIIFISVYFVRVSDICVCSLPACAFFLKM